MIVMYKSVTADLNIQICGQGIYNGRTNAMKSTACLISRVVKFTACMEGGKYKTLCRYPFRMHIYRNSSSIISDRTGAVFLQCYFNFRTVTGQMFIYRIVHDLIDQVVQTFSGYASDVHSRTFPNSFQSFQDRNTTRVVSVFLCHGVNSFLTIIRLCCPILLHPVY